MIIRYSCFRSPSARQCVFLKCISREKNNSTLYAPRSGHFEQVGCKKLRSSLIYRAWVRRYCCLRPIFKLLSFELNHGPVVCRNFLHTESITCTYNCMAVFLRAWKVRGYRDANDTTGTAVVYRGSRRFAFLYLRRPGGHFGQVLLYSAQIIFRYVLDLGCGNTH